MQFGLMLRSQYPKEENLKYCPECAGEIKKLVGVANFQLKGDGWYKPSAINEKSESE